MDHDNETFAGAVVENEEFECNTTASLTSRLACILSYGGVNSSRYSDIFINYTLVVLNAAYCHMMLQASIQKYSRGACAFELMRQRERRTIAHVSLAFIVAFQIVLCLALGCSGVSIIWCAMCGWILYDRLRRVERFEQGNEVVLHGMGQAVILLDCLAIAYYGVMFPAITTIAHTAAVVLGAILALISTRVTTEFQ